MNSGFRGISDGQRLIQKHLGFPLGVDPRCPFDAAREGTMGVVSLTAQDVYVPQLTRPGDLLIALVRVLSNSITAAFPTDWTVSHQGTNGLNHTALAWKFVDGNDSWMGQQLPGSFEVSFGATASTMNAIVLRVIGARKAAPIVQLGSSNDNLPSYSAHNPGYGIQNYLHVCMAGQEQGSGESTGPPTGYENRIYLGTGSVSVASSSRRVRADRVAAVAETNSGWDASLADWRSYSILIPGSR